MKFLSKFNLMDLTKRSTRWGEAISNTWQKSVGKSFGSFEGGHFSVRPHPLIGVVAGGFVLWLILDFFVFPYVRELEGAMSLRSAQWAQMENLVRLSKATPAQQITVEPLDDAELQRIRTILVAKKIKPSVLRLSLENPPRIEFQASEVLFSSVVDVLEELRTTWHLYPERVELTANPTMAMVNISATLIQTSKPSAGTNFSALDRGTSK
jgi:type II secretory pathway component PulM